MKALGITAMVIAIVAIFIPGVSLYITWLALILATIAAFSGEAIVFVILTTVIAAINVIVLSPLTMAKLAAVPFLLIVTLGFFAAPLFVLLLRTTGMIAGSTIRVMRS